MLERVNTAQMSSPCRIVQGCNHDCNQGRNCDCSPQPTSGSLSYWIVAVLVAIIMAAAMVVMGTPHEQ